ncbi:MAG TPA: glycosyltransferase N-terminal domain-containing protein, partial [Opitutaceae bacterium]
MIWIYRLLFPFALVLASPYYLLRMRRRGGYGRGFGQRFGSLPALPPRKPGVRRVWLQAVSVGEILAVEPIVRSLKAGGTEVILTTTTSTGHRLALERLSAHAAAVAYFPIDWVPFSARAWSAIRPDVAIVTEGERWPEHMRQAKARAVPVLCINARLSDRSYERMSVWPPAARFVMDGITRLLASSEMDAERFAALGFPASRITVTGNIKLDVDIPRLEPAARDRLRAELGLAPGRLVLLGSSTWPGEEEALLGALAAARAKGIACSLLLVPRHAERRAEVEKAVRASGFSHHLRSLGAAPAEVDVAIADTTGELRALTQLADLVFVGKSLAPHTEGQTPVEAAVLGKPILLGPGMANFRAIEGDLLARGAARTVGSPADLASKVAALLSDKPDREAIVASGAGWRRENGGGLERTLVAI